jgi:hypothetical protein
MATFAACNLGDKNYSNTRLRKVRRAVLTSLVMVALLGLGASFWALPPTANAARVIPGFEVFCFYSHSAQDDPIVNPNMPGGAMHRHDFAGNVTTNAGSTSASLRRGGTNCQLKDDTAAYWTPTLYSHGAAVHPDRLHSYYRWGNVQNFAKIRPLPADLKMIAGGSMASTKPQPTSVIGWNCGVQGQTLYNHPISCKESQKIVLHIFFPNCWDGKHLDSADHRSHMAYSHNGSCPGSHPIAVARLSEDYGYPLRDGTGITLSSGAPMTVHADFWNTWNQLKMDQLTRQCINAGRQCGPLHS